MPLEEKSIDELKKSWERIKNKEYIKKLSKNVADQQTKLLETQESYTRAIADEVRNITYDFLQPLFYDWITKKISEWEYSKLPADVFNKIDEQLFMRLVIGNFGEDEFG